MKYTEEDRDFIESWLNKCVKIEKDNYIYYVTSNNILRQLKYNRLYNVNKDIKIDLTKIIFNDNVILEQDLKNKCFWVNYYIIWLVFKSKYEHNYQENKMLINGILCDILILKEYTTTYQFESAGTKLCDILILNEYTTYIMEDKGYLNV